jgi:hypothetical protein
MISARLATEYHLSSSHPYLKEGEAEIQFSKWFNVLGFQATHGSDFQHELEISVDIQ